MEVMNGTDLLFVFFFNDTATTEIYTLSLHDALPIYQLLSVAAQEAVVFSAPTPGVPSPWSPRIFLMAAGSKKDRKSTRLNSSHANISYAVFCLTIKNTVTLTTNATKLRKPH